MKKIVLGLILGLLVTVASTTAQTSELPQIKGQIRQIDSASAKIKLKHEEIPNLNMPPMTMTFTVAEQSMLNGLVVGDKVLFTVDLVDNVYMILWIEKQ